MLFALLNVQEDFINMLRKKFCGNTRESVVFHRDGFIAHECGFSYNRTAYITAGSHNDIRLESINDFLCSCAASGKIPEGLYIVFYVSEGKSALDSKNFYGRKIISGVGNDSGFHSVWVSGEEDFRFRVFFFKIICNGDGRVDMSGSSAAGKKNFHEFSSVQLFWMEDFLDTERTIPISPRVIISAVPP